jgi:putative transposase
MAVLKQAEAGTPVLDLCREHGISNATFYKWRAKFGGMDVSLMAKMKGRRSIKSGRWISCMTS